jgi:hypothetical protein
MLDAVAKLLPPVNKFLDQIWPSVVATLIAAGLISGYNHAFSGHLQQPRMAALHEAAGSADAAPAPSPSSTVAMTRPPQAAASEIVASPDERAAPHREADKAPKAEAGKDQTAVKIAAPAPAPAARPTNVANPTPRPEPRAVEPRVASVPYVVPPAAAPVTVAPIAPPVVAAPPSALPPPVIMASPVASAPPMQQPLVTVPDRPYQRPSYEAQAEEVPPPPPPQGALGAIVNTLRPSSLFARAREFGARIEAAGNEILPNIRQ